LRDFSCSITHATASTNELTWQLQISEDNSLATAGRLEGEPQARGADLEEGRIESTTETAQTAAFMVE